MNFDDYQKQSRVTAIYPNAGKDLIYPSLGLLSEAGEVAGKVKKMIRDDEGVLTEGRRSEIKAEVGDVLWYTAQICTELGFSFEEVAKENLDKLLSRKERGVLSGSGDQR